MSKTYRFTLANGREICGKAEISDEMDRDWIKIQPAEAGSYPSFVNLLHVMTITPVPFGSAKPAKVPADQATKEKLELEIEKAEAELFNLRQPPCQCCPADIDSIESQDPR